MNVQPTKIVTSIPISLPWCVNGTQISRFPLDGKNAHPALDGCQIALGPSPAGAAMIISKGKDVVIVPLSLCYMVAEASSIIQPSLVPPSGLPGPV